MRQPCCWYLCWLTAAFCILVLMKDFNSLGTFHDFRPNFESLCSRHRYPDYAAPIRQRARPGSSPHSYLWVAEVSPTCVPVAEEPAVLPASLSQLSLAWMILSCLLESHLSSGMIK